MCSSIVLRPLRGILSLTWRVAQGWLGLLAEFCVVPLRALLPLRWNAAQGWLGLLAS